MKKITFIAVLALACCFASCKKDRTCTCTYSKPWASSSDIQVTTYSKVTKKSALANCSSGTSYEPSDPSKVEVRSCSLN
ncbi:MAG: hypothetical protein SGJ15_10285 [Bacteroidota bacterium]|nr:hypothetical protein [Bacteroidota bacterium]